jgi:hypothetical protein
MSGLRPSFFKLPRFVRCSCQLAGLSSSGDMSRVSNDVERGCSRRTGPLRGMGKGKGEMGNRVPHRSGGSRSHGAVGRRHSVERGCSRRTGPLRGNRKGEMLNVRRAAFSDGEPEARFSSLRSEGRPLHGRRARAARQSGMGNGEWEMGNVLRARFRTALSLTTCSAAHVADVEHGCSRRNAPASRDGKWEMGNAKCAARRVLGR